MNKLIAGLLVLLLFVLAPRLSASNDATGTIVLSKSNTVVLNGEVNGDSTSAVIAKAKDLDGALTKAKGKFGKDDKPLYLFLDTPGGSIQSGLEMIEALKGMGRKINTVTMFAASMGWQIVQNLDDRLILKNGVLMSHHAAGEFAGSFGGVHPSQMDSRYQLWIDRVRELDEQTVSRTGGKQTYESYTKQYDQEMWLTGTKAVAQGYADKVVLVKCDSTLDGTTVHHADFMGLDIQYELDNCPLNTSPMKIRIAGSLDGKPLSNEIANEVKAKFMDLFNNKQKQVVPMY